ncbi:MAG TPA: TonB-dependent receptor [Casimicrobiaceae bacterium]|nr:TonB-dependent receptor [Casimicrobiaceae bacterium]
MRILCVTLVASSPAPEAIAQYGVDESRGSFRIEVTGTRIPRSDVESALPVQILTREDIERGGVSTVAELMSKVSANVGAFGDALSVGVQFNPRDFNRPGLSSVNLRGIGDGSTLVLINGRRVANYAFDGGAVDVSAIPLTAIDRVEILKDGASAIYGTDAIAGVVNFILRKDYRGGEVTGYGNFTQHGGGNQYQASASAGYGDLTTDRFNAFITLDYQKDEALRPSDRSFAGYRADDPLFTFSGWTFPANVIAGRRRGDRINPSFAEGCAPPDSLPVPFEGEKWCGYNVNRFFDILPRVTRASALGRVTFQIQPNLQGFAEAAYAHNDFSASIAPTSAGGPGQLLFYPAGGRYYPTEFATANGLSGDLSLLLRTSALGPRVNDVTTDALRTILGVEGAGLGWNYGTAIVYSENRQRDDLASGYVSASRLADALATGRVNPFGPSGPEGDALLAGASIGGDFHRAKGSTWLIDFNASRELTRLAGGALGIALGAEARRERLDNTYSSLATSGDVLGGGGERASVTSSRTVEALFAEASIPFAAGIESQLALRFDHYSDFGSTVNPKVALRWQPAKALLLRTSWGTGFRAPTLYDLHTPLQDTFTLPDIPDPIRCPVTGARSDCDGEFPAVVGGNPNLKPETSTQFNAGVVWAPTASFSLSVDYWKIDKKNLIVALSEREVLSPDARFAGNAIRGPADAEFPDLPGPIQTVVLWNENFGDLKTSGYDVGVNWRAPEAPLGRFTLALDGTYVSTYEIPGETGGKLPFVGNNDGPYPVPRWRHYASVYWNFGAWSATLAQTFQSGYDEADRPLCDDFGCPRRRVGSYSAWNIQAEYVGFRNTRLAIGVKNLFDRNPPQAQWDPTGGALGFDPSYADPRGRSFYARIVYVFD